MKKNDSSDSIKFSEWRPIGVCDNGLPNEIQAHIFTQEDLNIVTAPDVNRKNWNKNPKINKIIKYYGKQIAKRSSMTKEMKRPEVAKISLVGTVLRFEKTPGLNQESQDGKVQLFQVEFKDKGRSYKWFWWISGIFLGLFVCFLGWSLLYEMFSQPKRSFVYKTRSICTASRGSRTYKSDLQLTGKQLRMFLNRQPLKEPWLTVKDNCSHYYSSSVTKQEKNLADCLLRIQKLNLKKTDYSSLELYKLRQCVENICDKDLSHIDGICRRIH